MNSIIRRCAPAIRSTRRLQQQQQQKPSVFFRRDFKTNAGSLVVGDFIEFNNRLYSVAEIHHVKKGIILYGLVLVVHNFRLLINPSFFVSGRGNAFMQTTLRTIDGSKKHQRFRSDEKVEQCEVSSNILYFFVDVAVG
jgi:translation elongation factor P/translation initiation factor 5A